MLKTLSAASLTLLLTGVAAPALAQTVPDWSGPYIGVFGGFVQPNEEDNETLVFDRDLDGAFDDTVTTSGGADAFSSFCSDQAVGGVTRCDDDSSGVEGGVKLGYDMQFGRWVIGAVGEIAGTDVEDSVTGFAAEPDAYYSFTRSLDQMAALRARVGFAAGPALIYATGGAAYGKVGNSFVTDNAENTFAATTDEDNADGYQFGGGVEWRLAPNFTVTGEYIYSDLETGDYTVRVAGTGATPATNPFILAPNTAGTDMRRSGDSFSTHGLRLGMNVRF